MKVLPEKVVPSYYLSNTQKIPKIIYQTFKTKKVTDSFYNNACSYIEKNPEYTYEFFDDDRLKEYIYSYDCSKFSFSSTELKKAFELIKVPAGRADIWRYLIIYDTGGVYADIDTLCVNPLENCIKKSDDIVTCRTGVSHNPGVTEKIWQHLFPQWFLIYSKHSSIMREIAEKSIECILTKTPIPDSSNCSNQLERFTGVCVSNYVYRNSIFKFKSLDREERLTPNTYKIIHKNKYYELSILPFLINTFNNTLIEKNYLTASDYYKDLETNSSKHWLTFDSIFSEYNENI